MAFVCGNHSDRVPTENSVTSPRQVMLCSMMPGRQTQKTVARIHHIHVYEKKVKSLFKLKIRSPKDGLPPA